MKPTAIILTLPEGTDRRGSPYGTLQDKKMAGAALDVFSKEPPTSNLLTLDNTWSLPTSASTREAGKVLADGQTWEMFLVDKRYQRRQYPVRGMDPKVVPFVVSVASAGSVRRAAHRCPRGQAAGHCPRRLAIMDSEDAPSPPSWVCCPYLPPGTAPA